MRPSSNEAVLYPTEIHLELRNDFELVSASAGGDKSAESGAGPSGRLRARIDIKLRRTRRESRV